MRGTELDAVVAELREAALAEAWSDAARAASAAARRSKAQGGDWRKAGRRAYGDKKSRSWRKGVRQAGKIALTLAGIIRSKREQHGVKSLRRRAQRFHGLGSSWPSPA